MLATDSMAVPQLVDSQYQNLLTVSTKRAYYSLLRHLVGEQRRELAFVRERVPDGLECLLVIGRDKMVMVA